MNQLTKLLAASALLSLSLGACAAMEEAPEIGSEQQALDNNPTDLGEVRDFPRGSKVVMAPEYEQELVDSGALDAVALGEPTLVYMNRVGGVFSPGGNDARNNRSSLAQGTVNFPAANLNDGEWNQVMSCVTQQFSRFNIQITDVDPGNTPHYESVVAGSPQLLGMQAGVGGVSPFTSNCDMIPNSIVFTFTDVLPRDPQIICQVAAQEIAHSFGLDHEYLCSDPMTYLSGCGAKSFQDVAAPCGENQARACAQPGQYDCGYNEQNSVQLMTARIGLNEGGTGNELSIAAPLDGANVNIGFEVSTDIQFADSVELRIDGITVASLTSGPFIFSTPTDLSLGTHVVEIVATVSGSETSTSISVNLVEGGGDGNGDGNGSGGGDGAGPGNGQGTPNVVGGCSTGGTSSGSAAFLLGLALFVLRRRKVLD